MFLYTKSKWKKDVSYAQIDLDDFMEPTKLIKKCV